MSNTVFSMTQRLKRLAWTNRVTLGLATKLVDAAYVARRQVAKSPRPTSVAVPDDESDLLPFRRYKTEFGDVGGWFSDEAIASWDCLLSLQHTLALEGNLMEIGVLKGKSAALLAVHSSKDETCVFVDPALRKEATDVIELIRAKNNVYYRQMSQQIRGNAELVSLAGTFRWVHIDGEHCGRAVANDLAIAEMLLAPEGIICLDDFLVASYPQITMATFAFLERWKDELTLFLCGFGKGYICRTAFAATYLEFLRDRMLSELHRRDLNNVTIWKTTDPDDMNCFGLTAKQLAFDYKGPDWAPDTIPI
jgi:hypothetical protein